MELRDGPRIVVLGAVVVLGVIVVAGAVYAGAVVTGDGGTDASPHATNGTDLTFREVSAEVGFAYNTTEPSGVISNAGVYTADYDDDGWTDLLAVGAKRPVLFTNQRGTFEPSGQLDGLDRPFRSAIFLDYDADGDEDLFLFPWEGRPAVLTNDNGTLRRTDGVIDANLTQPVGAAAGDYNRDGCPDLFVIQYGDWSLRRPAGHDSANVTPSEDNGNPNVLLRGTCGSFENATQQAGISGSTWSLATSMVNLDGDGLPDIHVANDFNNDTIYWNDGDGTFTRAILPAETNRNAMASEIGDFTGDGRPDLFVTNIHLPESVNGSVAFVADGRADGNNLLVNEGDRRFATAGRRCGVHEGGWGWAAVGTDLDNDGDMDIFHTTLEFTGRLGMELLQARQTSPAYSYPVLFEQRSGADCRFVTRNASAAGFEATDGHGAAGVDFDRDGDVDIAVAVSAGPTGEARYRLYENVGATGRALQVRIADSWMGGARVFVTTEAGTQMRVHHSRTDYFSQDERVLHFGVANHSTADVRVVWPNGTERTFEGVRTRQRLVISRDGIERTVALADPSSSSALSRLATLDRLLVALVVVLGVAAVGYRRYGIRRR